MKAGDRVAGPVAPGGVAPRADAPRDTGTVVQVYVGMRTETPYALVEWDLHGLHCARQADLVAEVSE